MGTDLAGATVLLNKGGGSFIAARESLVGTAPAAVAVSDLNGDGFADVAVARPNAATGDVDVLLSHGDGTFEATQSYTVGQAGVLAIGDLDGDALPDLVTGGFSETLEVLLNKGAGSFGQPTAYPAGVSCAIALGDLNGDKRNDVAAIDTLGLSVFMNEGRGVLQAPVEYAGADICSIALADLDQDGKPDLVTASPNGNTVDPFQERRYRQFQQAAQRERGHPTSVGHGL